MRYDIRLAGTGGQGLLLAGLMLAEAAAIYDGKYAVQSQSYAPFARGGASSSEIIIADEEIDYPRVQRPNILAVLSQEAYDVYARDLQEDGVLLIDASLVANVDTGRAHIFDTYVVPLTEAAREATGREMAASILALGVIAGLTEVVSATALLAAVAKRAPKGTAGLNQRAAQAGIELATKLKEGPGAGLKEGD